MAQVIDGRAVARELDAKTARAVEEMVEAGQPRPGLAVVLVGEDAASQIYVRRKIKSCETVGIRSFEHRLPAETSQDALLALIARLNADPQVHGILCQVPLPPQIDQRIVLGAIDPAKDVDGFHPVNVGRLVTGIPGLVPCTPMGVMVLLDSVLDSLAGLDAVVIGRSNIVGKPVAMLLLERQVTVTVAHSRTADLPEVVRRADIIIAAAGRAELVRGSWVKDGAVIVDVGINRMAGADGKERLVGDVAFDEVGHARAVTPVPGGVGPMTIACLLANTVQAAKAIAAQRAGDGGHDAPGRSLLSGG